MSKKSIASSIFNIGDAVASAAKRLKASRETIRVGEFPENQKKWFLDDDKVTLYHGTSKSSLDDIAEKGLKGDTDGLVYTSPDVHSATGYGSVRGGEKANKGKSGKQVQMNPDSERVTLKYEIPKEEFFRLIGDPNQTQSSISSRVKLFNPDSKQLFDATKDNPQFYSRGKPISSAGNYYEGTEIRFKEGDLDQYLVGTVERDRTPKIDSQMISVFPKPERMFPKGEAPKGGDYLNPVTGEVLTDRNVTSANIKINPDGKPSFKVSDDNVDSVGTTGKGNSQIKVNLFKKKAGWKWTKAPSGMEDIGTVVSVTHKGKHYYTFETDFTKGVNLKKYPNQKDEPKLRPTVVGKIELGEPVGEISVRGKPHKVYNTIKAFNKGGATMSMNKQMEMFDLGGLRDQGGTIDPKSKNPVPIGSTQEEVRDDIPAQLSEGEFVLPADVVRYHGLEKIMGFRDQAKAGLQRMEQMGQMGNADEATIPDGVPFKPNSNPLADEKRKMAIGGTTVNVPEIEMPKVEGVNVAKPVTQTSRPSVFATGDTTPTTPPATDTTQVAVPTAPDYRVRTKTGDATTYAKLIGSEFGQQQKTETIKYVNPDTNEELYIPFVNGEPIYPIPAGYIPETDVPLEEEKEDPTKAVKTTQTIQTDDGGGDDGVRDIRTTERPVGEGSVSGLLSSLLTPTIGKVFDAFSAPPMSYDDKVRMVSDEFGLYKTPDEISKMSDKEYTQYFSPQIGRLGGALPDRTFTNTLASLEQVVGNLQDVPEQDRFSIGTKPGQINVETRGMYGADGIAYNINANIPELVGGAARDANGNVMYSNAKYAFDDLKAARASNWYGGPIAPLAYLGLDTEAQNNYKEYQKAKGNQGTLNMLSDFTAKSAEVKQTYNVGGNNFGSGVGTRENPQKGIYVGAGAGPAGVVTGSWTTNARGEKQFSMEGGGTIIAGKTGVVGDFDGDGRPDSTVDSPRPSTDFSPQTIQAGLSPTVIGSADSDDSDRVTDPSQDGFESGFFTGPDSNQNVGTPVAGDDETDVSYVGDDPSNEGDTGGGGCVIATHGLSTGGFTAMEKAKAELWCQKTYHGKWYGEAFRRGYRAAGMKHINAGTAPSVYQEFKDFVAYGRGIKRGWKLGFNYYLRTITFFFTGLFIK